MQGCSLVWFSITRSGARIIRRIHGAKEQSGLA